MSAEAEVLCIPIGAIPLRLDEPMCNVSVGSSGAQTVYLGLASGSPRPSRPLCTEGTFLIFCIGVSSGVTRIFRLQGHEGAPRHFLVGPPLSTPVRSFGPPARLLWKDFAIFKQAGK